MKTLYEYCTDMMLDTQLAKRSGWTRELVLKHFIETFPDEADFRREMKQIENKLAEATGERYSWLDDYDKYRASH